MNKHTPSPRVSVCIPSYNSARFIAATIRSVLDQTFPDFELVVSDDGSTDKTVDIVRDFGDPRVSLVVNDSNRGAIANFNRCLALAAAPYVKVLPADDTLYPTCLARQVNALDRPENTDVAFVYCARDVTDGQGRHLIRARFPGAGRIGRAALIRRNVRHGMNVIGEPGAVLFRADAARKAGGFRPDLPYIVDLDCWIRLLDHGDAVAIRDTLCTFRLSGDNWSIALGSARKRNYLDFIARMRAEHPDAVSRADALLGRLRVHINERLRTLVYRFLAGRGRPPAAQTARRE